MTIFDWNQDGKINMQDDFLEYNIFKACTEDEDDNDDLFDSKEGAWYEKYMNYMYGGKLLDESKNKPNKRTANKEWTYYLR